MTIHLQSQADARGHHPGCRHYDEESPLADENSTHADLFCDCHQNPRPVILNNASHVAWPSGWSELQAEEWRRKNKLARPSEAGSGP